MNKIEIEVMKPGVAKGRLIAPYDEIVIHTTVRDAA